MRTVTLLAPALLVSGCADMQRSVLYPSELRVGVTQSEDDRRHRLLATAETVELRWSLEPAPVQNVSRAAPAPFPHYAELPCEPLPSR